MGPERFNASLMPFNFPKWTSNRNPLEGNHLQLFRMFAIVTQPNCQKRQNPLLPGHSDKFFGQIFSRISQSWSSRYEQLLVDSGTLPQRITETMTRASVDVETGHSTSLTGWRKKHV